MELLQRLRQRSAMPVVFLTSKDEEVDELMGLRLGADDYITKPFSQRLLLERIRALLRRTRQPRRGQRPAGRRRHRPRRPGAGRDQAHCVWKGTDIQLTVTEFLLVKALALRPGMVKNRDQLIDAAYGENIYVDDRTIDSHVKRVRKKFRTGGRQFRPDRDALRHRLPLQGELSCGARRRAPRRARLRAAGRATHARYRPAARDRRPGRRAGAAPLGLAPAAPHPAAERPAAGAAGGRHALPGPVPERAAGGRGRGDADPGAHLCRRHRRGRDPAAGRPRRAGAGSRPAAAAPAGRPLAQYPGQALRQYRPGGRRQPGAGGRRRRRGDRAAAAARAARRLLAHRRPASTTGCCPPGAARAAGRMSRST